MCQLIGGTSIYLVLTTIVSHDNPLMKWVQKQDNKYIAMEHIGTHLDTYKKTQIPLEYFKSRGIIFKVDNIAEIQLSNAELSLINEDDFVIFRTD